MLNGEQMENIQIIYEDVISAFNNVLIGHDEIKEAVTASLLCARDSKMLFMGNTGFGKSTLARYLSSSFNTQKISITTDTLPSEVKNMLKNNGNLQAIWIEEFNRMKQDVQNIFIDLFEGKVINFDGKDINFDDFYVFATQNNTDISGIFNVPQAVYDRIDMCFYFDRMTKDEERDLLFGNFTPSNKFNIPLSNLEYVQNIINNFPYTEKDMDIFMDAVEIIKSIELDSQYLFAGSNIRADLYLKKLVALEAIIKNRTTIIPSDIAKYIKYVYMHRIDQRISEIGDQIVIDVLSEAEDKILDLKRSLGRK